MLERTPFACDADRGAFALASGPEIVEYWTFEGEEGPTEIETDRSRIVAVSLLGSGDVLTVHQMGEIAAWSLGTEEGAATTWTMDLDLEPCAFAAHGPPAGPARRLALGARRGDILVLEPSTDGATSTRLEGHDADITELAFDEAGERLASAGRDHLIQIWSAAPEGGDEADAEDESTGRPPLHRLEGSESWPLTLAFSGSGDRLASTALDNALYLWRPDADRPLQATANRHHNWITDLAWSADDSRIATGSWDASAGLFGGEDLEGLYRLEAHTDFVSSVAFSGDDRLLTAGYDGRLCVWNWRDGSLERQIDAHPNWIERLVVVDGRALTLSSDGLVREWDPASGERTGEYGDPGVGAFDLGKEVDFSDYVDVPELPSDGADEAAVDIPDPEAVRPFEQERLEGEDEEAADAVSLLESAVDTSAESVATGEATPESRRLEPGSGDSSEQVSAESALETGAGATGSGAGTEAATETATRDATEGASVDEEDIETSVEAFDQEFDDRVDDASLDVSADLDVDEETDEGGDDEAELDVGTEGENDAASPDAEETIADAIDEASEVAESSENDEKEEQEESTDSGGTPPEETQADRGADTQQRGTDEDQTRETDTGTSEKADASTSEEAEETDAEPEATETMMSGGPVAPSGEKQPEEAPDRQPEKESASGEASPPETEQEDAPAGTSGESGTPGPTGQSSEVPAPDEFDDPQAPSDVELPDEVNESLEGDESKLAEELVSTVTDEAADETDDSSGSSSEQTTGGDDEGTARDGGAPGATPATASERESPDASATQQGIGEKSTGPIGSGDGEAEETTGEETDDTAASSTQRGSPVPSGDAETEAGAAGTSPETSADETDDENFSTTDTRLGLKAENQELGDASGTPPHEETDSQGPDLSESEVDIEVVSIEELWSRREEHQVADEERPAATGDYKRREVFRAGENAIEDAACRSGTPLVAVVTDGDVDLWNRRGEHLTRLPSANDDVSTVAFSRLGRALFGAGETGQIDVWLLPEAPGSGGEATALRSVLEGHDAPVTSLTTTPDGEWVMSGDTNGDARIFRLRDGAAPVLLESDGDPLADVAYGDFPVTASRSGEIAYWDAEGRRIREHDTGWRLSVVEARGTHVAWGAESGDVALHTGGPPNEMTAHDGEVTGLGMTPEGDLLSSGTDGRVFVYDSAAQGAAQRLECPEAIRAFDASSRLVVAGDETGYVHLFARN